MAWSCCSCLLSLQGMQWCQRQCLPGLILYGAGGNSSTGGAIRTSPSVNHFVTENEGSERAQELCENRGGRPGLPVPNKPTVSVDAKATLQPALTKAI